MRLYLLKNKIKSVHLHEALREVQRRSSLGQFSATANLSFRFSQWAFLNTIAVAMVTAGHKFNRKRECMGTALTKLQALVYDILHAVLGV